MPRNLVRIDESDNKDSIAVNCTILGLDPSKIFILMQALRQLEERMYYDLIRQEPKLDPKLATELQSFRQGLMDLPLQELSANLADKGEKEGLNTIFLLQKKIAESTAEEQEQILKDLLGFIRNLLDGR